MMMIKQTKLADDSDLQICCCLEHRRDYRSLLSSVYENAIISVYVDLYLINLSVKSLLYTWDSGMSSGLVQGMEGLSGTCRSALPSLWISWTVISWSAPLAAAIIDSRSPLRNKRNLHYMYKQVTWSTLGNKTSLSFIDNGSIII